MKSLTSLRGILRRYWPVLMIVLIVSVVTVVWGGSAPTEVEKPIQGSGQISVRSLELPKGALRDQRAVKRESPKEKAVAIIDSYRRQLAGKKAAPEGASPADLLMAMGNLYRQKLGDYEQAAQCYREVVEEHADGPHFSTACVQLSSCYEKLGHVLAANHLHRAMLKQFPEDSQEYLFAKQQLGW